MRLLPYAFFTLEVSFSAHDAADRLARSISPPSRGYYLLRFGRRRQKGFEGEVSGTRFRLNRITAYWQSNATLPHAYGQFRQVTEGRTRVRVRVMPHHFVLLFWLILSYWAVDGVVQWFREGRPTHSMWGASGLLLFYYLLIMLGWGWEIRQLQRFISGIYSPSESS